MLEANNCGKAMTVGNLKNKDLEGNELSSQVRGAHVHVGPCGLLCLRVGVRPCARADAYSSYAVMLPAGCRGDRRL